MQARSAGLKSSMVRCVCCNPWPSLLLCENRVLPEITDYCRLYLFRHPELETSHAELAVGAGPADLGHRGRAQTAEWLRIMGPLSVDAVWSSQQPQCAGPARALAEARGLKHQEDPRLRDQEMGSWQGRRWSEIARDEGEKVTAFFSEFGETTAPGGESLGQSVERLLGWWAEQSKASLGKGLVLVLPGSLLSGFAAAMLGLRLSHCVSLSVPHAGLGILEMFANGSRIAAWNATALAN